MIQRFYLFPFLAVLALLGMSVAVAPPAVADAGVTLDAAAAEAGLPFGAAASMEDFLTLTPKKVREMTGKKLSFKETIGLKLAQKKIKKQIRKQKKGQDTPGSKGLFIVLAIFVPIAAVIFMGVADDWEGNTWWIALLLYALCYLPGLIYTLTKVGDYYD